MEQTRVVVSTLTQVIEGNSTNRQARPVESRTRVTGKASGNTAKAHSCRRKKAAFAVQVVI